MSAGAVREEDAFDVARVNAWLREHGDPEVVRALEGEPQVRQFDSGASNLTYELRWPTRALVLRRPPHGALGGSAHNMHREHDLQAALHPVFPHVPRMVGLCTDPEVLGSDFYVMDKLEGTILGRDLPDGVTLTPEQATALCEAALATLVELHEVDVTAVPQLAVPTGQHAVLVVRPLVEPVVTRIMGIIRRHGATWSPAAQQFYQILKDRWRNE